MARLFKHTIVEYWIPAHHVDAGGNSCAEDAPGARPVKRRKVRKGTPGAEKVTKRSTKWYDAYTDEHGQSRRVPLSKNKTVAQQKLGKLLGKVDKAGLGDADPYDEHRGRPLAEHLADYEAELKARRRKAKYIRDVMANARRVFTACRFVYFSDVSASRVQKFLAGLSEGRGGGELEQDKAAYTRRELAQALGVKPATVSMLVRYHRLGATGNGKARRYPRETATALLARFDRGAGAKTVNLYLAAVKQFCSWMVQDRRSDKSPLQHLPFLNTQTDVRHARRALSVKELTRILDAALGSEKVYRGLTGRDRHALYLAAMSTGFRASELGALRPFCFNLDAVPAVVTLPAEHTKNKQPVAQPVASDVTEALRDYLKGRPADRPIWPGTWTEKAAEMLRLDLIAAGVAYVAEGPNGPEHADFHALRHSYITNVINSGVNVKVAQRLARHASVRLTLDRYSHVQLHEQAAAVENLPALLPPNGRPAAAVG